MNDTRTDLASLLRRRRIKLRAWCIAEGLTTFEEVLQFCELNGLKPPEASALQEALVPAAAIVMTQKPAAELPEPSELLVTGTADVVSSKDVPAVVDEDMSMPLSDTEGVLHVTGGVDPHRTKPEASEGTSKRKRKKKTTTPDVAGDQ